MGFWGTGAMDGDGPLDLLGNVARTAERTLRAALMQSDDGEVFAAAHIAMDLHESDVLGFEYYMFERGDKSLANVIRGAVGGVRIAEEWGGTEAREQVRRELLIRLDSIKARHLAKLDARRAERGA